MNYTETRFRGTGSIRFIGDVHFGDSNCKKDRLERDLKWCRANNVRIVTTGDLFNVAGRSTVSGVVGNNFNEYDELVKMLEPYKDLIIGSIEGNHETRMTKEFGFSPTQYLCSTLKIPYLGTSCVIRVMCGERIGNRTKENYFVYCHHTAGGGATQGAKANIITRLRDVVEGCDVYCGGHTHQLSAIPQDVYKPSMQGKCLEKRTIWFVGCGSYLDYPEGYAETSMLKPSTIGSPIITFLEKEHKCQITLHGLS